MPRRIYRQTEMQEAVEVSSRAQNDLAERYHAYMAQLFKNSTSSVIIVNEHFQVIDCNPAALEKFDWLAETVKGRKCSEVLQCRNLNGMALCGTSSCPLVRVTQQLAPLPNEEMILGTVPAHTSEFAASVTPLEGKDGLLVVFSARDVSALKVANSVRSNFVSMVSHELRTPLNSVHGFIDLLMQGHMGELTKEQKTYLGYAQEGVQQLIAIVEDILLMTRSDSGQFEIKPEQVNFLQLAKQVLRGLQPQALKASVILNRSE